MSFRTPHLVALLALLLSAPTTAFAASQTDSGSIALVGGTVFVAADAEPLENAVVIVRNGLIEAVGVDLPLPADALAVDVRGLTLSAAFIDAAHHGLVEFPDHHDMQGRPIDDGRDTLSAMVDGNRRGLSPDREARRALAPEGAELSDVREAGFGAVMVAPDNMLLAGRGVWLLPNGLPVREALYGGSSAQFGSLNWRAGRGDYSGTAYPATLMGAMAHLRQFFLDAQHQGLMGERFAEGLSSRRPLQDPGLEAIQPVLEGRQQLALRADAEEDIRLALQLAQTFGGIDLIIVGGREAWELTDELLAHQVGVILDLDFPDEPDAPRGDDDDEEEADDDEGEEEDSEEDESDEDALPERLADGNWPAPLPYAADEPERLLADRHDRWVERVSCAAKLIAAGVPVAFGSFDSDSSTLLDGVATAIEHGGLDRADALRALTTAPSRLFGSASPRGELVPGSLASITVWEGEPADDEAEVRLVVVDGQLFDLRDSSQRYTPPEADDEEDEDEGSESDDDANEAKDDEAMESISEDAAADDVTEDSDSEPGDDEDPVSDESADDGDAGDDEDAYDGPLAATPYQVALAAAERASGETTWPVELDQDRDPSLKTGGDLLLRGATLHTVTRGTLEGQDMLVLGGRISSIGENLSAPEGVAIIDGTGLHAMPGVLDAHSHIAIRGGVNEWTRNITPEVTIEDEVDPDDVGIYRALAGGTTSARLLHGSANAIGGRHEMVKLRWGVTAPEMVMKGAPRGVKFALGENPRQANWGSGGRFPKTRMGVAASIRRAFEAGQDYATEWDSFRSAEAAGEDPDPPRRDLRLEALSGILSGAISIHSHCYRAHEILMLIEVAEAFGVKVATFQHVLEGYKVAAEIRAHGGLGASTFIDWWGFKFEAYDAIPFNPALVHEAGVMMSINSDSGDHIRRLNLEAAKAVKYGGVPEADAMAMVTLVPAKQLGVDDRLGSLDVGKDADFALYSGHPFDTLARVERSFVDGRLMFERRPDVYADWNAEIDRRVEAGRAALADLPEFEAPAHVQARNEQVDDQALTSLRDSPTGTRAASTPARPFSAPVALVGATVHTMELDDDGLPIVHPEGTVLLADGLIAAVLPNRVEAARLEAEGYEVRDLSGFDVWPGLIDGGTTVGLGEISAVQQSMDVREVGGDQPDMRASMGWHPDSETIPVARANGITSALIEPGGGWMRGQSALFGLEGWTVSEAIIAEGAALHLGAPRTRRDEDRIEFDAGEHRDVDHLCLGGGGADSHADHEHDTALTGGPDPEKLAERIESAWASLAQVFADAREYARWSAAAASNGEQGPPFDPRLDAMGPYALGVAPVIFHADRADQIADALDFADTHGLRAIISGGREAWKVADRLALADVGVIVGPVLSMPMGSSATYDGPYSNAGLLHRAGVRIGFRSGSAHGSRDLPYHAAMAVAFGLDHDAALSALTRGTAEMLGLGDQVGRLAPGLRADLLITAGDPLQIRTPIEDVIIGGRAVGTDSKHTRLYERYRERLHEPGAAHLR